MKAVALTFCTFFFALVAVAGVTLPRLISDGMVLQRGLPIKIWGWANSSEKVTVKFNGKTLRTTTGTDGKWHVFLPAMKAGGPYTMEIKGANHLVLKDILIGDVWVCAGQSNMVHSLILHRERYEREIESANFPQVRNFTLPTQARLEKPGEDLSSGGWKTANPQDVLQFSVVAYFFAKKIYEKYGVPIGLINASVGGTPIEAWTSEKGFEEFPTILDIIKRNKDTAFVNNLNRKAAALNAERAQRQPQDKGLTGAMPWYDTAYTPKGWRRINIPGYWEDQGIKDLNGTVWYRKEIEVPQSMTGVPARVYLGRIVDADSLYINGVPAGNTAYQYPQRKYRVPAGVLRPGKNIFVVRVVNNTGKGGFVPDKPYYVAAGGQTLDLKGDWQYKVGEVFAPVRGSFGGGLSAQNQPTALYNGMIAPLINSGIKGILWYQGESNTGDPALYEKLLPALIKDWRNKWKRDDLPFLFVQLPNFMEANYLPSESQWAALREAQLKTLSVPNTGMAVAIDLGEWNDIHPGNKKDVGERLALAAMNVAYGDKQIVSSGPIYKSANIEGKKITISFQYTGTGLATNDDEQPNHFAIAGADKKFVWANAKIEGDKVVVWHQDIVEPRYVRYAWADNPDSANLYNKEGLPASPFRTDQ